MSITLMPDALFIIHNVFPKIGSTLHVHTKRPHYILHVLLFMHSLLLLFFLSDVKGNIGMG